LKPSKELAITKEKKNAQYLVAWTTFNTSSYSHCLNAPITWVQQIQLRKPLVPPNNEEEPDKH
jgi:hypothetical protein